ncbi:MAG: GNAT family N-acetyltransferase [Candidatus Hermodarchaeota archaeon]|nr:GNAT family N-acetyltransferase [Candidatus Hermodarchaeota archaeon]
MTLTIQRLTEPTNDIEDFLRTDIILNGLPLYDLTLAWDITDWFIAKKENAIQGCLIIYKGGRGMGSFFTRGTQDAVHQLVAQLSYPSVFAIIPENHVPIVEKQYQFLTQGRFLLMKVEPEQYNPPEILPTERLFADNLEEVDQFYQVTPAGAWNPRQLDLGPFYGIRQDGVLVSVCGTIGVYKPSPGVAVIGNLATLPHHQKRGFGTSVLCAVTNALFQNYQYVTLMVESDNFNAIRIYQRIGFTHQATFAIGVCQRIK